jgi:hypothetical protein
MYQCFRYTSPQDSAATMLNLVLESLGSESRPLELAGTERLEPPLLCIEVNPYIDAIQ